MLLQDKTAIIYGAGGGLGSAVSRTFAEEGATVFLAGRRRGSLEAVATAIAENGGTAHVAVVDALDEAVVEEHAASVAEQAGRIDVSFNLIGHGDVQGTSLIDMRTEDLTGAAVTSLTSNFLTARAAARRMVEQGSGVILSLSSASGSQSAAAPGMGSTGPADAATDAFYRYLAAEVGPSGVRVVTIYTAGVAETLNDARMQEVNPAASAAMVEALTGMTMLKRLPKLREVCDTAAFLASDRASGMTATIANVTCGLVPGI
jgi:NAD(P)-dependent dehydrogenase (short-subunit alcohol dehydrogenase family)